jgi:hypothetical protein
LQLNCCAGGGGGGHSAMEATEWCSDTEVQAKRGVFGIRASSGLRLTSGVYSGAGSVTHAHSYDVPMLSSMHTTNQPARLSPSIFGGYVALLDK